MKNTASPELSVVDHTDPILTHMRAICLALPETKETLTWGHPHFRVGEKIFAGYERSNVKTSIGFKLELAHADLILGDPRFSRAAYVGNYGWVSMDVSGPVDWSFVAELVHESFRLIAPKRTLAKLLSGATPKSTPKAAPKAIPKRALSRTTKREPMRPTRRNEQPKEAPASKSRQTP